MRRLLAGCATVAVLLVMQGEAAARVLAFTFDLAPDTATQTVGDTHYVTATVTDSGRPLSQQLVMFEVIAGPNAGPNGEGFTDGNGQASFNYLGSTLGTDTIEASWRDFQEILHTDRVQVTWVPPAPPPSADLSVSLSPGTPGAEVGDQLTFTATVTNGGPSTATGIAVSGSINELLSLASVSASQGSCSQAGNTFSCALGSLGVGSSATVAFSGTVNAPGDVQAMVSVAGDLPDPNSGNNPGSTTVPAVVPPPVLGQAINVKPISGIVLVNGKPLVAGQQIPVGAKVDTRKGVVELESAHGTAKFWAGLFQIAERRTRTGVTKLILLGGNFRAGCGHPARLLAGVERHRKKVVRRLWGDGRGSFQTSGRYSTATVRGTFWLTSDRCDGTLTAVRKGRVEVFDTVLKKKIVVRAGKSYLARPR